MAKKKLAAGILFTDGEKILLMKRNNEGRNGGKWDIPAGGREEGETARENEDSRENSRDLKEAIDDIEQQMKDLEEKTSMQIKKALENPLSQM
jgi:hypothetical protein